MEPPASFQSRGPTTPAELTEGHRWDSGPAELLLDPSSVSPLLCHPQAALLHTNLNDDGHLPLSRPWIPNLHFQRLQVIFKQEALSTVFKGGHFLPTLVTKCLVTLTFIQEMASHSNRMAVLEFGRECSVVTMTVGLQSVELQVLEDVVKDENSYPMYRTVPPNEELFISLTIPKCLARYPYR